MLEDIPLVEIREGLAKILVPDFSKYRRPDGVYEPAWAPVFYNPKMELNRDIAVLALSTYAKTKGSELTVADILGGTGVRAIRFALEVPNVSRVYVNDKNPLAYELAKKNIELNKLESKAYPENFDANLMLQLHRFSSEYFDYIDIDPFGSPIEFLDSAIMSIRIGGMLGITATDTATLEGTYPHACLRKYLSKPLKADFSKEMALRILIANIAFRAAAYEYGINIKLGYYSQYYARVYVTLEKGAKKALTSIRNIGYVVFDRNSGRYWLFKEIKEILDKKSEIGNAIIGGPLWLAPIAEESFIKALLKELSEREYIRNKSEIRKLLTKILSEINLPPLYYRVDLLGKRLKKSMPPFSKFIECIESKGYVAIRPHSDVLGLKTNAPFDIVVKCFKGEN